VRPKNARNIFSQSDDSGKILREDKEKNGTFYINRKDQN
jgi:hypothetical protein